MEVLVDLIIALSKPETVAASGMVRFFDEDITIKLLMVDTLTMARWK
jgi:hypothetical protein